MNDKCGVLMLSMFAVGMLMGGIVSFAWHDFWRLRAVEKAEAGDAEAQEEIKRLRAQVARWVGKEVER